MAQFPGHGVENGGTKRPANFEHLEFCNRLTKKSSFKYPWDLGLNTDHLVLWERPQPVGMAPLVEKHFDDNSNDEPCVSRVHSQSALRQKFITKQPRIDWDVKLNAIREANLVKWQKIVCSDPLAFDVCRSYFSSLKMGLNTGTLIDCLRNIFSSKSSSTLANRAGLVLRYMMFCSNSGLKSFPICEEVVYAYLLHEEQVVDAAPTYHRSFLSSIAFCIHVLGLASAACVLESKRICGLAAKRYLLKKKTRSRLPLLAKEVLLLERIVLGRCGRPLADRHAAGCFLFMVFARARYSDMQNVSTLQIETEVVEDMRLGYVECGVGRSKTSFSLERKVRLLPMSATVNGLFPSESWAMAWHDVIGESGVEVGKGKPLLPARTQDGWHSLPLTAEAASHWLRALLQIDGDMDAARIAGVGTHSLKSTCLSWLSKWGTSPDTRRLLGYHVADKMSTMMIYGKDNTSAGLRELDEIIAAIRCGSFCPDNVRALMFPGRAAVAAEAPTGNVVEQPECDTDSSSEDSADEDRPDHDQIEKAEQHVVGRWDGGVNVDALPPCAVYHRHNLSRTIHMQEDESGLKFVCGRDIGAAYVLLGSRPQTLLPVCKQCFIRFALR